MIKEKSKVIPKEIYWLLLLVAILFIAVYVFTLPAFVNGFNLEGDGQIGDTIGGITAPFINLLGAVLVYYSFKAQITANRNQFTILKNQMVEGDRDRNYEVVLRLFSDVKSTYSSLEFGKMNGRIALVEFHKYYLKHVSDSNNSTIKDNILKDFNYLLYEYNLLLERLNSSELRANEQSQLIRLVLKFHDTHLLYFYEIMKSKSDEILKVDVITKGDGPALKHHGFYNHFHSFKNIEALKIKLEQKLYPET